MIEAVSCGGIVIYRGKILTLYKSYRNKYEGWVLPKGTVEPGETHEQTAVREVYEESGVHGTIIKYVGKSQYSFSIPEDTVEKEVHWYLMVSSGLLQPSTERRILCGFGLLQVSRSISSAEVFQ